MARPEASAATGSTPDLLNRLLARDRWIVGVCLALVAGLAWIWLLRAGAGMGPEAMGAGAPQAMSGMETPNPAPAPWSLGLAAAFVMWLLMMTAMMLPSAAPMILLYARFVRGVAPQGGALAPTAVFAATYLAVWAGFSLAAAALQTALAHSGWISAASLALGDRRLAGGLLILAGLYQVTPLKRRCLESCRSPLSFLTRLWRPGWAGAVRLGAVHGAYCVGCCWLLMALLFVGGVMNLAWVAVLALIVLIEKVAPLGPRAGIALGAAAMAAGAVLAVSGSLT